MEISSSGSSVITSSTTTYNPFTPFYISNADFYGIKKNKKM